MDFGQRQWLFQGRQCVLHPFLDPCRARSCADSASADPGNGQTLGSLPEMTVEDTKQAVNHAHEALKTWRQKSEYERAAILTKIFQ